ASLESLYSLCECMGSNPIPGVSQFRKEAGTCVSKTARLAHYLTVAPPFLRKSISQPSISQ
ncbi:MAG: hypothetical protein QME59_08250, partial [Candidatus Hydrothermarchaeota archaeon]|nr:hypothetical protein [Candidatus Hydrothermarchaeota archaeon]